MMLIACQIDMWCLVIIPPIHIEVLLVVVSLSSCEDLSATRTFFAEFSATLAAVTMCDF